MEFVKYIGPVVVTLAARLSDSVRLYGHVSEPALPTAKMGNVARTNEDIADRCKVQKLN